MSRPPSSALRAPSPRGEKGAVRPTSQDEPLLPPAGEGVRRTDEGCRAPSARTVRARSLRRSETDAEHKLWLRLRDRRLAGHKLVRQLPIGPYFADFACRERGLVIELDGGQHAENQRDMRRDRFLNQQGFAVLRFWNNEVFASIEAVCATVLAALEGRLDAYDRFTPPPSSTLRAPSPRGEKGAVRPTSQDG